MYSKEELDKLVEEIKNNDTYNDLGINEQIYVLWRLLDYCDFLITPYMIDTDEDEEYVKELEKAIEILNKLRGF